MLKSLVIPKVAEYFQSEQWNGLMDILRRGSEVRHAHVYTESILSPFDFAQVIQGYFEKHGLSLERKITFLSHGRGYANIYYIQPRGMCHFEVFLKYNDDVVIEPAGAASTRTGQNLEYWDDAYMEKYHAGFAFREPTAGEEKEILAFFRSPLWRQACEFMTDKGIHCHVPVETCIHPDILMKLGIQAIEAKNWSVSRAVTVVYSLKGYDQGKVTFLLKKPEIVLELDWEFNPDTVIQPRMQSLMLAADTDDLAKDLDGIPYYRLSKEDIRKIVEMI